MLNQNFISKIKKDLIPNSIKEVSSPSTLFNGNNMDNNEIQDIIDNLIPLKKNDVISKNLFSNIDIYDKDGNDIFSKIDNTKTLLGSQYLKNIIQCPLTELNKLIDRQNQIKNLKALDDDKKIEISSLLNEIKSLEKKVLWFWKNITPEIKYLLDSVYFKNSYLKKFNGSENVLNLVTYFNIIIAPMYGMLQPVIMILLPYLYIKFFTNVRINFTVYFRLIKFTLFNFNPMAHLQGSQSRSKLSQIMSTILSIFFYITGVYNSIENSKFTNSIVNEIHSLLNNTFSYICKVKSVSDILMDIIPSNLSKIFEGLNCKTFSSEPNLWSKKGKILIEFNNVMKNKDKLKEYFDYISNVDCMLSIVELNKNNYTFSKYSKNKKPLIDVKSVWNPIIGIDNSIKNDILIGGGNPNNIIMTGPNAGGKTTFIKNICLQILLSQSLTVSPCESLKVTPFSIIGSHMNISDNIGKDSLFESEMNRAKSYLHTLTNLNKSAFSFLIMDEIFSSTNPEEGMSGGYAIGEKLGQFDNSISLITTHYYYLTKLEKTGNFKNYKITVDKENDNIKYPYKIQEGYSKQHIALELLSHKGFDKNIINRAIEIRKDVISSRTKLRKKKKIEKKVEDKVEEKVNQVKINSQK